MERYSDRAIEIINELHRERLDYQSEYLPLIDAANKLSAYEDTGLEPEQVMQIINSESLRPHGKWVKEPFSSRCVCTNCKSVFPEWIRVYNYCPLCGARMMEEEAAKFIQAFGEMMKNETKVG